ncbi:hypothetical protein [Ruegeria profundi]|uniref:hypothetical protein n=1 Tax=Ruegeria profundi TaxID=1685378 RepID=UPI001CD776E1|nr:hypothetical protein [Ruegeria profundi]MCA0929105.1 hypothetical protein [Ruegeria profundi]
MSCPRLFDLRNVVVILAAQLCALPAIAESYRSGGFIIIGSTPPSLLDHSKHKVHRYYGAPSVYHPKPKPEYKAKPDHYHHRAKPKLRYFKPVRRHHQTVRGFRNKHASPYFIQRRYGIQRRGLRFGGDWRRH